MTLNVLILCTHNSARSVLSEGMLNHWAQKLGKDVKAFSAGSAPSGKINPFAIDVLQAAGVNTEGFRSKSWDEFATLEARGFERCDRTALPASVQASSEFKSLCPASAVCMFKEINPTSSTEKHRHG